MQIHQTRKRNHVIRAEGRREVGGRLRRLCIYRLNLGPKLATPLLN